MWNGAGNNATPCYNGISPDMRMNNSVQMHNDISAPMAAYNNLLSPHGRRPVWSPQTHHPNFSPAISNNAGFVHNTVTPNNSMNSVPLPINSRFSSEWLTVQSHQSWSQPSMNTNTPRFQYNSAPASTWMNDPPFGQHGFFSPLPKRIQCTESRASVAQHGFCSPLAPASQYLKSYTPPPAPRLRSGYYLHTEFLPPSTPQNFRSPDASTLQKQQRRRIPTAEYPAPIANPHKAPGATEKYVQTRSGLSVPFSTPPLEGYSGCRLPEIESEGNTMVIDQAQQLLSLKRRRIEVPDTERKLAQAASQQFRQDLHRYQVKPSQAKHQKIQVEIQSQAVASLRIEDSAKSQLKDDKQICLKKAVEIEAMELENQNRAYKIADNITHHIRLNPDMLRGREKPRMRKEFVTVMPSQKERDYHAHLFHLIQENEKKMREKIRSDQGKSAGHSQFIDLTDTANYSPTTLIATKEMVGQLRTTSQLSKNTNSVQVSAQLVACKGSVVMEQPVAPLGDAYIDRFEDLEDFFDQPEPISEKDLDDQLRGFFS